ncbi:hypothetical protein M2163_005297 [Streptomyces sp. SAI-135]|nr:hypothetical protein [Streptomyces sp. SAI-135]
MTIRFWVPSCSDRSMRRSSVAWASSAAARVAVSVGDPQGEVGVGTGRQEPASRVRLEPCHAGGEPQQDGDPAHAEQAHREGVRPGVGDADPDGGGGGVLGGEAPVQREHGVPQGEHRQDEPEQAQRQAHGQVPDQPQQFAPGRGVAEGGPQPRRWWRGGDDLGAPAGEAYALHAGQGVQHAHPAGRQQQPQQHERCEDRRTQSGDQLAERGGRGGHGAHDKAPEVGGGHANPPRAGEQRP